MRTLLIIRDPSNGCTMFDGVAVASVIIALLENIDLKEEIQHVLTFLWEELEFIETRKTAHRCYKSMIL